MRHRKLLTAVALCLAMSANAQTSNYPHAFVGLQGGVMYPYNGEAVDRKWSPMAAVSLGYNFTNVFGLRLQANGSKWTAQNTPVGDYKSKVGNIDLDMLFNLSNVFFPNSNNFVNVIAIAGAPFNLAVPHAWVDNYPFCASEGSDRWNTAWKVGGMIDFNIAKNFSFNLEAGTNYMRQKNEGIRDNNKWWPYAMAGISYKFGFKKAKATAPVAPPTVQEQKPVEPAKPMEPAKLQEVFVGKLSPSQNQVDITVKNMPKFPLDVDQSEMKYFSGNKDLEYRNMQTGLAPNGQPEITYVEIYNPSNGKTYTYRKMEQAPVAVATPEQPKVETNDVKAMPAQLATQNIFYDLAKTNVAAEQMDKIDAIVKFAKENPKAKISLVGYADKGTGTTAVNKRFADQRAKNVKQLLVKKGIKASRISVSSKGDTEQPFTNNDDNRVVIVVSE